MKITIPKTIHPLDLAEYDPSFEGQTIDVWVNPPTDEVAKIYRGLDLSKDIAQKQSIEKDEAKIAEFKAQMDEVGKDQKDFFALVTGWQGEEVTEFIDTAMKTDPQLWPWAFLHVFVMVANHQANRKKV